MQLDSVDALGVGDALAADGGCRDIRLACVQQATRSAFCSIRA
jgi:hypothetical protein